MGNLWSQNPPVVSEIMARGTKTLFYQDIRFWHASMRSLHEILHDDAFEGDRVFLQRVRASVSAIADCKASACVRDGGVVTPRRYVLKATTYQASYNALHSYCSFLRNNYYKLSIGRHPKTFTFMFTKEPPRLRP